MFSTAIVTSALLLSMQQPAITPPPTHQDVIIPPLCRTDRTRPGVIIPPRPELCDGLDNDCDGEIDEDFDLDGDGYYSGVGCEETYEQLDCVDEDETIYPGATEMCDGTDNNCNEAVDEDPMCTPFSIDGDLLSVYGSSGEAWWINTVTAQSTQLASFQALPGETGMAIDNNTTAFYTATGESTDALYHTSFIDGTTRLVGNFGQHGSNMQAIDIAPAEAAAYGFTPNTLYGINIDGSEHCGPNCLVRIDATTGVATPIAAIAANQIRGMSFDPITGELWVLDPGGRNVYTLKGSGALTYKFTLAPTHQDSQTGVNPKFSLSHNCTGDLFTVDQAYGVLVQINETTGAAGWKTEPFALHDSTGSHALQGLDAVCQ